MGAKIKEAIALSLVVITLLVLKGGALRNAKATVLISLMTDLADEPDALLYGMAMTFASLTYQIDLPTVRFALPTEWFALPTDSISLPSK